MIIVLLKSENLLLSCLCILNAHSFIYFLKIYPGLPLSKGRRLLRTPKIFKKIADFFHLNRQNPFEIQE